MLLLEYTHGAIKLAIHFVSHDCHCFSFIYSAVKIARLNRPILKKAVVLRFKANNVSRHSYQFLKTSFSRFLTLNNRLRYQAFFQVPRATLPMFSYGVPSSHSPSPILRSPPPFLFSRTAHFFFFPFRSIRRCRLKQKPSTTDACKAD